MAETYSFEELLGDVCPIGDEGQGIDRIVIPIIQRDYAQGRLVSGKDGPVLNPTGKKFIREIFSALTEPDGRLEMDFIYGSLKTDEEGRRSFIPLDGQQRLSTLFLLHWFLAGAELPEEERARISTMLRKFRYETRVSSERFCRELACELTRGNIDFLGTEVGSEGKTLDEQIENLPWFHGSYRLDPTVAAMLTMLDEIRFLYLGTGRDLFQNLSRLRFYVLPLNNFGLTEDLYVKMNARGKQLTDFETFKADLQDHLKKKQAEWGLCERERDGRRMPFDLYFISKMDNEWAQCFWEMERSDEQSFDGLFFDFIRKFLLNDYLLSYRGNNRELDKQEEFLLLSDEGGYSDFAPYGARLTADTVQKLAVALDALCEHFDDVEDAVHPAWQSVEKTDVLKNKLELKGRVIFCALMLYLTEHPFDRDRLAEWMRVAWNIAENADIDNWSVVAGVIALIKELSSNADRMEEALADPDFVISSAQAKDAVAEERQKATLLLRDTAWRKALTEAEGHPFFKGSIGFLLPKSGDIDDFRRNFSRAKEFFGEDGIAPRYRGEHHLFLRALISRYSSLADIRYHLTDADEKEHSLKKMLSSDATVKKAIAEWFALSSEREVCDVLHQEVQKSSPIVDFGNDFGKKLHEALYRKTDLVDWMQERKAIRYRDNFLSRPNSSYDWIYVYGYTNEIIDELVRRGCECKNVCKIGEKDNARDIPYYWSAAGREIDVVRTNGGIEQVFSVGTHDITIRIGDNTEKIEDYHSRVRFASEVSPFVDDLLLHADNLLP